MNIQLIDAGCSGDQPALESTKLLKCKSFWFFFALLGFRQKKDVA
jgi:hypothetical protein